MAELKAKGYAVTRSAASKGEYDLIAIGKEDIRLIQVKRTKAMVRRAPPEIIRKLAKALAPDSSLIRKQLWCWVDHHGWVVTNVEPDESREISA